jgi:hypothetical protein
MIKPELYFPGGREHVRMLSSGNGLTVRVNGAQRLYGLKAPATDSLGQGRLNLRRNLNFCSSTNKRKLFEDANLEMTGVLTGLSLSNWSTFWIRSSKRARLRSMLVAEEGLMIRVLAGLFRPGYDFSVVGNMTAPFLTQSDLLVPRVGPGCVSTIGEVGHFVEHYMDLGYRILAVYNDWCTFGCPQSNVQDRSIFGQIDPFTSEHRIDACP